MAIHKENL